MPRAGARRELCPGWVLLEQEGEEMKTKQKHMKPSRAGRGDTEIMTLCIRMFQLWVHKGQNIYNEWSEKKLNLLKTASFLFLKLPHIHKYELHAGKPEDFWDSWTTLTLICCWSSWWWKAILRSFSDDLLLIKLKCCRCFIYSSMLKWKLLE